MFRCELFARLCASLTELVHSGQVELTERDDGGGRMRWIVATVSDDAYRIEIVGGTDDSAKKYLSVSNDEGLVELSEEDINSERRKWVLTKGVSNQVPIGAVPIQRTECWDGMTRWSRGDIFDWQLDTGKPDSLSPETMSLSRIRLQARINAETDG